MSASFAADTNTSTTNEGNDQNNIITYYDNINTNVNSTDENTNVKSNTDSKSNNTINNISNSNTINSNNTINNVNTNSANTKTNTTVKAAGELTKLSQSQILQVSKTINNYISKYNKLPNYITISDVKFSMPEYIYLLGMTIYYKYNKKTTQVSIKYNIKNPSSPTGATIKGSLTKAQYYVYAKNIVKYIKKYNKAPNYVNTKLGKIQYQTAIFMLNKIAYYSATHSGSLASTVSLSVSKSNTLNKNLPKYERTQTNKTLVVSGSKQTTISQSLIWSASTSIKNYVNSNGKLPNYVTISGYKYSMPEFLYLLSKAINTRLSGSTSAIAIKYGVKNPSSPSGATISKTFTKSQYNDMAKRFVKYINTYNKAPNCLSSSYGVGNIQYQTALYGLSCVGSYIGVNKAIPTTLTIKVASSHSMNKYLPVYTSSSNSNNSTNNTNSNGNNSTNGLSTKILGSNNKGTVELIGAFGNTSSKVKIAYVIGLHPLESAVHNALYNAIISKSNLKYCYYIYRINVTKDPNNYSEGRMNGQLLAEEFVLPHIISNNYNLVIDVHSNQGTTGGSYEETNFIFAPLNHTASKIIADSIISKIPELTYYYPPSQTSPPFLTNPLVQAGIPTILYETYMYESASVTSDLVNKLISTVDSYNFGSSTNSSGTISLNSIIDAASRVKAYVDINGVLPNYVTIGTTQYSMSSFLYLLSKAIVNINKGLTSGISPITVASPSNPSGAKVAGTINKANYTDIALRVSNYIAANVQAPNYASSTLGNIQFQSLVYELSKVLNYLNANGVMPNTLTINTSNPSTLNGGSSSSGNDSSSGGNSSTNSSLAIYLKATKNCEVNNANIKSLASQLTAGLTTDLAKATAIFNYVRDKISYSFYYNTAKGAVGTLNAKSGNCVDQTHLLIALLRASGIASRYVNGEVTFTQSGRLGHVWAEVYIDGKWVIADTTSSSNSLGKVNNWNTNNPTIHGRYAEITF
ncbi:pseudomurein-binding repeat-containing protein [Methanobrevibacter arboriphilus]|uniref:pseudomurein-binding repeat-containing protein n=1 Tax=Methanobrevibacter arboriphilus TaxID=39441 RepID=UPI001301A6DB|nr:transglutaminase domain-containing protein [Methanobrevibacter arboriphilus]